MALQAKIPAGLDRKESEVYRHLDPARLPQHIAIIMDGNGRWAKRRHMPRVAGHRAGVEAVRSTVQTAARIGIRAITLYAFSEENWKKRPKSEVDFLMRLLSRYLKAEVPTLNKNNIRMEYIGRQQQLPDDVQERMAWARESTAHNSGTVMTLAQAAQQFRTARAGPVPWRSQTTARPDRRAWKRTHPCQLRAPHDGRTPARWRTAR